MRIVLKSAIELEMRCRCDSHGNEIVVVQPVFVRILTAVHKPKAMQVTRFD